MLHNNTVNSCLHPSVKLPILDAIARSEYTESKDMITSCLSKNNFYENILRCLCCLATNCYRKLPFIGSFSLEMTSLSEYVDNCI